ncbi:MAG: phosphatidylglycerophosphatase A [Melioribacteraceae bacterium]|nr:phosphatidylglycerophosphatase A [Melioribacteraceae bacterium]
MNLHIKKLVGSGFYSGYIPFAPGTFGSIVALAIYLIPAFQSIYVILSFIIFGFFIGIPLGNYFEEKYGKDPKQFTFDEFIGTWIAFLYLPQSIELIALTFIIWRFFDIVKPFPANRAESVNGGLGIMLDDVISGLYSLIIMYIFKILFY